MPVFHLLPHDWKCYYLRKSSLFGSHRGEYWRSYYYPSGCEMSSRGSHYDYSSCLSLKMIHVYWLSDWYRDGGWDHDGLEKLNHCERLSYRQASSFIHRACTFFLPHELTIGLSNELILSNLWCQSSCSRSNSANFLNVVLIILSLRACLSLLYQGLILNDHYQF